MSKKDYIAAAEMFKSHHDYERECFERGSDEPGHLIVERIAKDMAIIFKRDNSLFDRTRFLTACGIPQERQ